MVTHSPPLHHFLGQTRCLLKIIGRAGRHLIHKDFFSNTATHQDCDTRQQVFTIVAIAVFLGQLHRDTQCPAAGNDGDLVHRVGLISKHFSDHGMARLMICSIETLFFRHHDRPSLDTHDNFILSKLELLHRYLASTGASRKQRRFIHEIGQIRSGKTRRSTGNNGRVHIVIDRYFAHVYFENRLTTSDIRQRYVHLAIEAPWAQ